jgi:Uma2 family endonuclease
MSPSTDPNTPRSHPTVEHKPRQRWLAWSNVGWKGYRALDRLRGEKAKPRLIYLDGTVYVITPPETIDRAFLRLSLFVSLVAADSGIPHIGAGQTTLRDKTRRVGVEGDQEFYFTNYKNILGNTDLDMSVDPPPDLVIESLRGVPLSKAFAAYRRLGVPEVWAFRPDRLRIWRLHANGRYFASEFSRSIPFLQAETIFSIVSEPQGESDTDWIIFVRRWVRETLVPRVHPEEA